VPAFRHTLVHEHERAVVAGQAAIETSLDLAYRAYAWVTSANALIQAERPEAVARIVGKGLPLCERAPS
jgi:hypothetical protein